MFVNVPQVNGGKGGRKGRNGLGGAGGAGGRGGSSYSWEETTGFGDNKKTERHFKFGGISGHTGIRGMDGNAVLFDGPNGNDGRYSYVVTSEEGVTAHYKSRYDIRLFEFEMKANDDDGVFEPGEACTVTNF